MFKAFVGRLGFGPKVAQRAWIAKAAIVRIEPIGQSSETRLSVEALRVTVAEYFITLAIVPDAVD